MAAKHLSQAPPPEILAQYCRNPAQARIRPLGHGLINQTLLVEEDNRSLVLQRINEQVFHRPELISANLLTLDRHLQKQTPVPGRRWQHCTMLPTLSGAPHCRDQGLDLWRALRYIANSRCHERLTSTHQAREAGWALGLFHARTQGLNPDLLQITLPGFHVLPDYLAQYDQLKPLDQAQGADHHRCRQTIERLRPQAHLLEEASTDGQLQVHCCHGDPKAGNILFDRDTGEALSLIDLDTVGPGLRIVDLADCLRSCCSRQGPEVKFDLQYCSALLTGYGAAAPGLLCENERQLLTTALRLVTFELGLRFFSDHLRGDTYFKVTERGANLHRARQQFQLLSDMEDKEERISALLARLA